MDIVPLGGTQCTLWYFRDLRSLWYLDRKKVDVFFYSNCSNKVSLYIADKRREISNVFKADSWALYL